MYNLVLPFTSALAVQPYHCHPRLELDPKIKLRLIFAIDWDSLTPRAWVES